MREYFCLRCAAYCGVLAAGADGARCADRAGDAGIIFCGMGGLFGGSADGCAIDAVSVSKRSAVSAPHRPGVLAWRVGGAGILGRRGSGVCVFSVSEDAYCRKRHGLGRRDLSGGEPMGREKHRLALGERGRDRNTIRGGMWAERCGDDPRFPVACGRGRSGSRRMGELPANCVTGMRV